VERWPHCQANEDNPSHQREDGQEAQEKWHLLLGQLGIVVFGSVVDEEIIPYVMLPKR
jgi:hypothetical protein